MFVQKLATWLLMTAAAAGLSAQESGVGETPEEAVTQAPSPNFLIVVADDMGWSDIGVLGGEIRTPTLDSLAREGTVMTQYYVAPTCSPTRSMLMTGLDNHPAGVGTMHSLAAPNQTGRNYAAQLHGDVVTMAEALAGKGYETLMSGKWHLAVDEAQRPHNRGFDRSFSLLPGGASHFADQRWLNPTEAVVYLEDGEPAPIPADFYSTINYTDKLLQYLEERDQSRPFLAYLAYTAPHDPLQVPDDWLDRYRGAYADGPGAIRQARNERQKAAGLFPADGQLWEPPQLPWILPNKLDPWDERDDEERFESERRMEIYASMVELMDQQLARVIEHLRDRGDLENTYVLFFSDNGASSSAPSIYPGNTAEWLAENWSLATEDFGQPGSFAVMSREWATVANTPWRLFKGAVGEGGIRSPFIVRGPRVPAGVFNSALSHVSDVAPTLYALAGVVPEQDPLFSGKLLPQGIPLHSVWTGDSESARDGFAVELFGSRAIRSEDWKATMIRPPQGSGRWELFDLGKDPGETTDVGAQHPQLLQRLQGDYQQYAQQNGVIHPIGMPTPSPRAFYPSECDWFCELRFSIFARLPKPSPTTD